MAEIAIIKIHEGPGNGLVLNCTDLPCNQVYESIAARIDFEFIIIDVSNLTNPLEVMQQQAQDDDTLFCLKTNNFYPGDRDDVERWLSGHDIPDEILKYCGDLWVVAELGQIENQSS